MAQRSPVVDIVGGLHSALKFVFLARLPLDNRLYMEYSYIGTGLDIANPFLWPTGCLRLTDAWLCYCDESQIRKVYGMTLMDAVEGKEYIVQQVITDDEELDAFLFSLGCYAGEPITVVSRLKGGCIVSIKDGRYNIDNQLAAAIEI